LIDANGNVGIGNSFPAYALDVSGLGHFTGLSFYFKKSTPASR